MKARILGLLFLGLTTLCYSQIEDENVLTEIEVYAKNYVYLKSVVSHDRAMNKVSQLERKVANFDVNSLNLPHHDYSTYRVNFFIDDGEIRAKYDSESNIIRTIESFKNVDLPLCVRRSIVTRYPDHLILEDEYQVNYHFKKGVEKKFSVLMEKDGKQFWVKADENGIIL